MKFGSTGGGKSAGSRFDKFLLVNAHTNLHLSRLKHNNNNNIMILYPIVKIIVILLVSDCRDDGAAALCIWVFYNNI